MVMWDINSKYYQVVTMVVNFQFHEVARVLYIMISVFVYFVAEAKSDSVMFFIACMSDEKIKVCACLSFLRLTLAS